VIIMGTMLIAQCDCGFKSNMINAGGGMSNFNEVLNAPAFCKRCKMFLVKNYLEQDPRCPRCKGKIHFYNDPALFKGDLTKEVEYVFHWRSPDNFDLIFPNIDNFFCLPNTDYMCPRCGKMTMKFIDVGFWD